jgi:hypothetical protein
VTELQGEFNSAPGFHVDLRSRERGHYRTCNRAAVANHYIDAFWTLLRLGGSLCMSGAFLLTSTAQIYERLVCFALVRLSAVDSFTAQFVGWRIQTVRCRWTPTSSQKKLCHMFDKPLCTQDLAHPTGQFHEVASPRKTGTQSPVAEGGPCEPPPE